MGDAALTAELTASAADAVPAPARAPPLSYGRSVLASLATLNASALSSAPATLASSPCLRPALLWAGAVGGLLAAHRAVQGGRLQRCANDALVGGLLTAGYQWYQCRNAEHDVKLTTRAYYEALRQEQAAGGEGARPADSGVDAAAAEAWQRKLATLVR